jgi:hypothetical protein
MPLMQKGLPVGPRKVGIGDILYFGAAYVAKHEFDFL